MILHGASMDDARVYSLTVDGPGLVVIEGFTLVEFACKDGSDNVWIHPWLLEGLWALRGWCGGPVSLSNGFRTMRHNKAVGGRMPGGNRVGGSRHMYGEAADVIRAGSKTPDEVAEWAEVQGWGGIGRYNSFTHLDVYGQGRRWDNRT